MIICKDTSEKCLTYREYMKSEHWKNVKRRYRESKLSQKCHVCGAEQIIHIHHKTYKNIGNEKLTDLIALCDKCHSFLHQRLKEEHSQKINKWSIVRRMKKSYGSKKSNYNSGTQ